MILIDNVEVVGWGHVIRGMRNPMNSWDKIDSYVSDIDEDGNGLFLLGENDYKLMMKLAKNGPVHAKYRRMITVYLDITAPLYWWKEFDTYKVGTVANSCSTMHKIHAKKFERRDFSMEHLKDSYEIHWTACIDNIIASLNMARDLYLETHDKRYWWHIIQLLPSSYNQKRTIMLNYEVLAGIYEHRQNHKLDEWRDFCKWIEWLPHSEIICENIEEKNG